MDLDFDPDVTRHNEAPYWAAALVLALQAGDKNRVRIARQKLRALGYALDAIPHRRRKGVSHDD